MANYWFRPRKGLKSKELGWGYIPINWKGVVVYIILFALIIYLAIIFNLSNTGFKQGIGFLIIVIVVFTIFNYIAKIKTKRD